MRFSASERLILSNQYRIMARLFPEEERLYTVCSTIMERGYTGHYYMLIPNIQVEIAKEICIEVLDVLEMHRALLRSQDNAQAKTAATDSKGINDNAAISFDGFHAYDLQEMQYLRYAAFLIEELALYPEFRRNAGYECERPMLPRYRSMIKVWKTCPTPTALTSENIQRILEAKSDPEILSEKPKIAIA